MRGRAAVTGDTGDIGKFRTPSLRNVRLHPPYGADGTVPTLAQVIQNYSNGGNAERGDVVSNQDIRIKKLNLTNQQMTDLEAFLDDLTDDSLISNPAFQDPGPPAIVEDGYVISGNLSAYPNPATGTVNIECPDFTGSTDATLVSASGATVWRQTLNSDGKLRLDFSGIANGSYLALYFAPQMCSKRYRSCCNARNLVRMFRMKRLFYLSMIVCSAALHTSAAQAQWVQTNGPYGEVRIALPIWGNNLFFSLEHWAESLNRRIRVRIGYKKATAWLHRIFTYMP